MKQIRLLLCSFTLCHLFTINVAGQQACSDCSGVNQSPVEIVNAYSVTTQLNLTLKDSREPLETIYAYDPNTKKAINIEVEISNHPPGYTITLNGITYKFSNVHFHLPSEHKLNNKFYSMEAHFVFKSDKASQGAVVIGMLIDKASGKNKASAILDSLVQGIQYTAQKLPDTISYHFSSFVNPERFNLNNLLKGGYYSYTGSLTTPPYSEGLTWLVLKQTQYIDDAYYNMFKTIQQRYNFGKARVLQPINNRVIINTPARK